MIEIPSELSPTLKYESIPEAVLEMDSSYYPISAVYTHFELSARVSSSLPKIY